MQKSTMRIEDACIWRKALAEHPDETMTILLSGLRRLVNEAGTLKSKTIACVTLLDAGFETGYEETK